MPARPSVNGANLAISIQIASDPIKLGYYLDIVLLAIFGVFALANLRRAFASLFRAFEPDQIYPLHYVKLQLSRSASEALHRGLSRSGSRAHAAGRAVESDKQRDQLMNADSDGSNTYPKHVSACPPSVRFLAWLLQYRVDPGVSLGQLTLLAGYFAIVAFGCFHLSDPVRDPDRTGHIAVSQIPVLVAFATKNSIPGWFLGIGYEKLNYIHRFAGRLIAIATNMHSISYIYRYTIANTLADEFQQTYIMWGVVALVCVDVLALFSLSWFRRRAYRVFYISHVLAFSLLGPALYYHSPVIAIFLFVAGGFYALDHLFRLLKTRVARATIRPIPELCTTRVEIPLINAGWRAGQHVRVRVISFGMGWFGWAEAHPFTIASASKHRTGLVLLCKSTGGWTGNLYKMAKASGYGDGENGEKQGHKKNVWVIIEGPYGGLGHLVFASYSGAFLVAGGSGISFALSVIRDLVQKDSDGASRVRIIELIWVVQDPASLLAIYPSLSPLIDRSASVSTPLRVCVHYTRATAGMPPEADAFAGIVLAPGRPRLRKALEAFVARASALGAGAAVKDAEPLTGVAVGVCGPPGLRDAAVDAVRALDPARRDRVGGVEVHEEAFH